MAKKQDEEMQRLWTELNSINEELNAEYDNLLHKTGNWQRLQELGAKYSEKFAELEKNKKKENQLNRIPKPLPNPVPHCDNYPAYNLDRTEYIEEFIDVYSEYLLNGGLFCAPVTSFDKYGGSQLLEPIAFIKPCVNGKWKYHRIIYKLQDWVIEQFGNREELIDEEERHTRENR